MQTGIETTDPPAPMTVRTVVVDDSEDVRALLRLYLERQPDFTIVAEAADGELGVRAVESERPDLVLLDVSMPVMDGLDALTLIREQFPDTVVVMLSAFGATTPLALSALARGAHGYVEKGHPLSELAVELRGCLARAGHAG